MRFSSFFCSISLRVVTRESVSVGSLYFSHTPDAATEGECEKKVISVRRGKQEILLFPFTHTLLSRTNFRRWCLHERSALKASFILTTMANGKSNMYNTTKQNLPQNKQTNEMYARRNAHQIVNGNDGSVRTAALLHHRLKCTIMASVE